VWTELKNKLELMGKANSHVKVGVLSTDLHSSGFSIAELAAVHEFGSRDGRIPQRSFIGETLKQEQPQLVKVVSALASQVIRSKATVAEALERLGLWSSNAIKRRITGTDIPPPLKTSTINRKGSSKPLIDTGQLLNSISYEVVE
jgi:hypothetical protein